MLISLSLLALNGCFTF